MYAILFTLIGKNGGILMVNKTLLVLILASLAVSGCIGEQETAPTSTPTPALPEISQAEMIPGEFDININSYFFVYLRDNKVIQKNTTTPTFDLVEKNYVIYNLSIKNNDTSPHNFSRNNLQLHANDQVFTPADPGTFHRYPDTWVYVLSEIEKEQRLNDSHILPSQTLKGIVIFKVDNYTTLLNRSFSLRYNTTPIPSTSFEMSLEALTAAEQFDYSIAFDMPPYDSDRWEGDSYYPPEPGYSFVWANWVNKTVFESYKKHDEMALPEEKRGNIPYIEIAYAVKVIPGQDLTVFHTDHSNLYADRNYNITREGKYRETQMYVIDGTGKELFKKSIDSRNDETGLVIFDNQTYRPFSENMPPILIPQATIVQISFYSTYGWGLAMRLTFNNQDIILDEHHNITLSRYDNYKVVS